MSVNGLERVYYRGTCEPKKCGYLPETLRKLGFYLTGFVHENFYMVRIPGLCESGDSSRNDQCEANARELPEILSLETCTQSEWLPAFWAFLPRPDPANGGV